MIIIFGVDMLNVAGVADTSIDDAAIGRQVKFILAKVSLKGNSKTVLRAKEVQFHNDIYLKLQEEVGEGFKIDVTGGGMIFVNPNDKTIRLSGASTAFGVPDFKIVEELLKKDYPQFKVVVVK